MPIYLGRQKIAWTNKTTTVIKHQIEEETAETVQSSLEGLYNIADCFIGDTQLSTVTNMMPLYYPSVSSWTLPATTEVISSSTPFVSTVTLNSYLYPEEVVLVFNDVTPSNPTSVSVYGSNDKADFILLATITVPDNTNQVITETNLSNKAYYKYYRFVCSETYGNTLTINKIKINGKQKVFATKHWLPNPKWWNVESLVVDDTTPGYIGKIGVVLTNSYDTTILRDLSANSISAVRTSDGSFYTYEDTVTMPNATIYGTLASSNAVLSGFSTSNYARSSSTMYSYTSAWELNLKIATGSDVTTTQYICNAGYNYKMSLGINSSAHFVWNLSSNNSSWNITSGRTGSLTLSANTDYWIRMKFTGSAYTLEYSTDGTNYTTDMTVSSSTSIYTSGSTMYLGCTYTSSATATPFLGSIDFKECSFSTDYSASYNWFGSYQAISHTWDPTYDKPLTDDASDTRATRYMILYSATETISGLNTSYQLPSDCLYAVFHADVTAVASFMSSKQLLQSFKFTENHNIRSTQAARTLSNFCSGCYSLQKLPPICTEDIAIFGGFCSNCSALKELPAINTDSCATLSNFCYYCYSLERLPETMNTSNCATFSYFCAYCYSLRKLPKGIVLAGPFSTISQVTYFLVNCRSLESIEGTINLSSIATGSLSGTLSALYSLQKIKLALPRIAFTLMSSSTRLSKESLDYLANNAPAVSNLQLTLGADNIKRAGTDTIALLTSKGWRVV